MTRLLRQTGHAVRLPFEAGMAGEDDPVYLAQAIREDRILVSHNHHDFEDLHNLLKVATGHHPGMLVVRKDNNPKRDLNERGIVRAIGKLLAAGVDLKDHFYVLNHWR